MIKYGLSILLIFLLPAISLAASNSFTISQQIGLDNIDPTTPANVVATAISSSRIDVSWSASSDNFAVAGYQVLRDDIQIATTTSTAYSDTGLSPATSYSYTIRAFDTSFNYSTTSAAAVATTNVFLPSLEAVGSVAIGGIGALEVRNLLTTIGTTSIGFNFSTNNPARAEMAWGRSGDYEMGYSVSAFHKYDHSLVIPNLDPGTLYEVRIRVFAKDGQSTVIIKQIRTKSSKDKTAPTNPANFRATYDAGRVLLDWLNPSETDFAYVKILSSDRFYPGDPFSGYLVYQGNGTAVADMRFGEKGIRYYSIFAYDTSGNVSSGAIVKVILGGQSASFEIETSGVPISTEETIPDDQPTLDPRFSIDFSDLIFTTRDFMRENRTATTVYVSNESVINVSLSYERLPENLKTIVVTLTHPDDPSSTFSFLLRVNADKTAYEARIGALKDPGSYKTSIEIYDFKTHQVAVTKGTVVVVEKSTATAPLEISKWWLAPIPVGFILVLLLLLYRRRG